MDNAGNFKDDFRSWWDIKRIWSKKPNEKPMSLRELA